MRTLSDSPPGATRLRILHVLRAPVGGLFRHVTDVAREQAARGHLVGVIADSTTGGDAADQALRRLGPRMALGVTRIPMRRAPHWSDLLALAQVTRTTMTLRPDVLHGHGAKGGLYVRAMGFLPCPHRALRVYTPHGGSLHRQCGGALFIAAEKALAANTDLLLFESEFIARRYKESVGATGALRRVARNGLREEEFAPVAVAPDAADFLTIGELSRIKGVDTLLEALALLRADGLDGPRLAVVGSGPEADRLAVLADRLGVSGAVAFHGAMPAREAFALGRILVLPSRAESLPYIVLEALAAQKPLVATNVGGVPEILGPFRDRLVPPGDPAALARALAEALRREPVSGAEREALARHIAAHFALGAMVDAGLAAYKQGLSMLDVRSRHLLEAL